MSILELLPWFRKPTLRVDYAEQPVLPRDATEIVRHNPCASGIVRVHPRDLVLLEIPRGCSYAEYQETHKAYVDPLCDAVILDAFGDAITAGGKLSTKPLKQFFGNDFRGQVFFLGTSFRARDGQECVSYLNVGLSTPAVRNMCPVNHPVNHDVGGWACHYVPDPGVPTPGG